MGLHALLDPVLKQSQDRSIFLCLLALLFSDFIFRETFIKERKMTTYSSRLVFYKLSSHSASFADSSAKSWGRFPLSPAWVLSPSLNKSLWPWKRIHWYSWIWVDEYHLDSLGKSPQRNSMLWLGFFMHFLFPLCHCLNQCSKYLLLLSAQNLVPFNLHK